MVISKSNIHPRCNLTVEENNIKQVEKSNYIRRLLADDSKCDAEIRRIFGLATETFKKCKAYSKIEKGQ